MNNEVAPVGDNEYQGLMTGISELMAGARHAAARSVNTILTTTYWEIGRRIVEFEQRGARHAEYGTELLKQLGADLTRQFGRGFSWRNLYLMRTFYLTYPNILQTVSAKLLPWSHYVRLLSLNDPPKRDFYEQEAHRAGWSVRQLDRQIASMLYERVALSQKKEEALKPPKTAMPALTGAEAIKDPYVLEFLGLPEPVSERDLESALITHLTEFLLELGYGFTFVARQKRLQVGTESYHLDLLFYHRGLRCLVAIELKVGKFTPADAGQMNFYLNYLDENERLDGENDPIGLILCTEKDETVVHYSFGRLSNKIFASRYQLHLPAPEALQREIEREKRLLEGRLVEGGHKE